MNEDDNYLRSKLLLTKKQGKNLYYQYFLCPLFFEGFAIPEKDRSKEINNRLGKIPYLNGGLFLRHQIEEQFGSAIQIHDDAFDKIFDFFDSYQWHLDERPLKKDDEINPDVLGYIFEKYINQKQMGAYYTKEDITEHISKNTIIPFLFEKANKFYPNILENNNAIWAFLKNNPDRYIYDPLKYGISEPLPTEIEKGLNDIRRREEWNNTAIENYGLPTETWREICERRLRYYELKNRISKGEIHKINDFITYNLNIRQFAQDIFEQYDNPDRLRAFWHAIKDISVLDPTCGSGAFLFAAVNVLEPLYEACLDGMEEFIENNNPSIQISSNYLTEFKEVLEQVAKHPSRRYFVFKSIIINNLFGVDIMEEAVEICKLRLFLKLISQIEKFSDIEPLPDIDFNIRVGNTLIGYLNYDEVKRALKTTLDNNEAINRIDAKAQKIESCFITFRNKQISEDNGPSIFDKSKLLKALKDLDYELNRYLAYEYSIPDNDEKLFREWINTHKPFHWFVEFYGIIKRGGFDIIIGNPPYVEYNNIKRQYVIKNDNLLISGNLHSMITQRVLNITCSNSYVSFIVPVSLTSTDRMEHLRSIMENNGTIWFCNFDIRPSKLFIGAEQRLTIFIFSKSEQKKLFTSKYRKWNSEERPFLFQTIIFVEWTHQRIIRNVWPKIESSIAKNILEKVSKQDTAIQDVIGISDDLILYYKNTGIRYFVIVTLKPPICFINGKKTSSSRETILKIINADTLPIIHCLLNSSLFYVIYQQLSNCRDLNPSDILKFRFPEAIMQEKKFVGLSHQLNSNHQEHSFLQIRNQKQTGEVKIQSFYPSYSKNIIDQIDSVLAPHYHFTDEELDYLINYDIKYRIGTTESEDD